MGETLKEKYTIRRKLNAFEQLELTRKLSPAISILEVLVGESNIDKPKGAPMVMVLGSLPQANYDYVLKTCLSVINRIQPNKESTRLTSPDGDLMFDDTSANDIVELIAWVIEDSLGDFLRTTLSKWE